MTTTRIAGLMAGKTVLITGGTGGSARRPHWDWPGWGLGWPSPAVTAAAPRLPRGRSK